MIIYNTTWLENLHLRTLATIWFKKSLITEEEKTAIEESAPVGFYSPSFWISLGLYFFTMVLIFAAIGLVALFVFAAANGNGEEVIIHIAAFAFAAVCLLMTEHYKTKQYFFHAGTDNALLWAGLGFLIGNIFAILYQFDYQNEDILLIGYLLSFIILLWATVRYADVVVAISAFIAWFLLIFISATRMGDTAKALLPFIGLANAVGIYFLAQRLSVGKIKVYWANCLAVTEALALIVAYASVNYFVVREMSDAMFDLQLEEGQDIPFAFLFYFFTVGFPAFYIFYGLKLKNRTMLRIGLLLIAASILTIRQYHSVMPIEIAMTLGGILFLGVSYGLIRFLKTPKNGFTYENEDEDNGLMKIEGLVIAQTFGTSTKADNGPGFGGGQFGGGGASETY